MSLTQKRVFIQHSVDFFVFLGSFLSNIIILWLVPAFQVKDFASFYLIGNAIFSLLVYYQFTNVVNEKHVGWSLYILSALFFLLLGIEQTSIILYFFYPYFYLIADYLASQKFSRRTVKLYRLATLFTVSPFFLLENKFDFSLTIRIIFFIISAFVFQNVSDKITPLAIRARWKFVFLCYLSYTLPLYLITAFSENPFELKVWYVSTQIGIAIVLKYYEFSGRGNGMNGIALAACAIFSIVLPIVVLLFSFNLTLAVVYWMGVVFLLYAARYVKNEST